MRIRRREFLKTFSLLSSAAWAPTFLVNTLRAAGSGGLSLAQAGNPDRILVVVELAGGCDGLNTVVPYSNDLYYSARPALSIPSSSVLTLDSELALHPAMTGIKDLYDEGRVCIVNGVGYPNPNRSHFRSRDIWYTAEPDEIGSEGWLAKYLDEYDNGEPLQGVNVGGRVPKSLISGEGASASIQSIDTYKLESDPLHPEDTANKNAAFQAIVGQPQTVYPLQQFVTQTVLDATLSSAQLLEGQDSYQSTVEYPESAFATSMRTIAQIISAELGVTVFYATLGGFDTHASQVQAGDPVLGTHATLLDTFSGAVAAFLTDIREMGRQDDVLVMSFSEFGRRLAQNGSLGTDHGTANQMFVFGDTIQAGLLGQHPSLAPADLDNVGDMVFGIDFRDVYATILENWLGADSAALLGDEVTLLDIV